MSFLQPGKINNHTLHGVGSSDEVLQGAVFVCLKMQISTWQCKSEKKTKNSLVSLSPAVLLRGRKKRGTCYFGVFPLEPPLHIKCPAPWEVEYVFCFPFLPYTTSACPSSDCLYLDSQGFFYLILSPCHLAEKGSDKSSLVGAWNPARANPPQSSTSACKEKCSFSLCSRLCPQSPFYVYGKKAPNKPQTNQKKT